MEWITPEGVAAHLGGGADPADPELVSCVGAVRSAVEARRTDLVYTDETTVPEHVRRGAVMWAAVMYQQRSAPSGFDGYDAESALMDAGAKRAEIRALLGWRRPVVA